VSVRENSVHKFFLPDQFPIFEHLHWRSSTALFAMMSAFIIVVVEPVVQIGLQFFECAVNFSTQRRLVKHLQDGLVESLTDPVRLRMPCLGSGVLDFIDGQVKLVVMLLDLATVLGTPVNQDPQHGQIM
jgi:hypothetical protein